MNGIWNKIVGLYKKGLKFYGKHKVEILTGAGVAGGAATIGLTIDATVKAVRLYDKRKEELGVEKLTTGETIKTVWKPYVKPAVTGILSTACVVGSANEHVRRSAAAGIAYNLLDEELRTTKKVISEKFSEDQVKEIKQEIANETYKSHPLPESKQIIVTSDEEDWFYEPLSGRYFKSTKATILTAVAQVNTIMSIDNSCSVNKFYSLINLEDTKFGETNGWNLDGNPKNMLEVDLFEAGFTPNKHSCIIMSYNREPFYGYDWVNDRHRKSY